jgi:hypothetical protein
MLFVGTEEEKRLFEIIGLRRQSDVKFDLG